MRLLPNWEDAAALLARGGIVLLPTDTLPGLHCRADLPRAVSNLNALKQRRGRQPFLLLSGSMAGALEFTSAQDPRLVAYVKQCWPGPFSLILPASPAAPDAVTAGGPTVALRVPRPYELQRLVTAAGFPLVSSSANLSGQSPAADMEEARHRFQEVVDGVLAVQPSWQPGAAEARASALVDLTVWPPRLLREGPEPLPPWQAGA